MPGDFAEALPVNAALEAFVQLVKGRNEPPAVAQAGAVVIARPEVGPDPPRIPVDDTAPPAIEASRVCGRSRRSSVPSALSPQHI